MTIDNTIVEATLNGCLVDEHSNGWFRLSYQFRACRISYEMRREVSACRMDDIARMVEYQLMFAFDLGMIVPDALHLVFVSDPNAPLFGKVDYSFESRSATIVFSSRRKLLYSIAARIALCITFSNHINWGHLIDEIRRDNPLPFLQVSWQSSYALICGRATEELVGIARERIDHIGFGRAKTSLREVRELRNELRRFVPSVQESDELKHMDVSRCTDTVSGPVDIPKRPP